MATAYQNLSEYDFNSIPDASEMNIGIVVAEWNKAITEKLLEGACNTLEKHGVKQNNIVIGRVPGSVELTFGAKCLAENKELNAVILLGCVVRGDTPHFDYVCDSVTLGVTELNLMYDIPFIFGLLTTENMQQAEDRAGGKYGNKGDESAITAIKMIDFSCKLQN
ncbi:6,7-dimethyl-8-ribityllumazine synthase [Parabacteroides sp. 52]|uniref:6,7-dimethyl-8-ribityllumazine synthase n=1 Tax=unclassified Parabacteroides TaxID=2649774 RepID=UPI0013D30D17|nr:MULTISPECIES: 6,7-dimethyl-8-ribityllumazine synthase [unclassified Parabacteroides]MDH6534012.1 6,7-dimethyl-8-ribityllumazine synthase [Parabacteroides sp. PM5-20]NDV54753.1 6,7-dimethyl-8-ribityllumazine synthase [Parabacteroides sp. 52]